MKPVCCYTDIYPNTSMLHLNYVQLLQLQADVLLLINAEVGPIQCPLPFSVIRKSILL